VKTEKSSLATLFSWAQSPDFQIVTLDRWRHRIGKNIITSYNSFKKINKYLIAPVKQKQ
jgi:hypothetical protein